jgi:hypothetical protein
MINVYPVYSLNQVPQNDYHDRYRFQHNDK